MKRTTIMLPSGLKSKSQREARRLGISLGELIRKSLESELDQAKTPKRRRFFPDFDLTFEDDLPADVSANLGKYLEQIDREDYQRVQDYARQKNGRRRGTG